MTRHPATETGAHSLCIPRHRLSSWRNGGHGSPRPPAEGPMHLVVPMPTSH